MNNNKQMLLQMRGYSQNNNNHNTNNTNNYELMDEYVQNEYLRESYVRNSKDDKYKRNEYVEDKYVRDGYVEDKYVIDEYVEDKYIDESYSGNDYASDNYARDEYSSNSYYNDDLNTNGNETSNENDYDYNDEKKYSNYRKNFETANDRYIIGVAKVINFFKNVFLKPYDTCISYIKKADIVSIVVLLVLQALINGVYVYANLVSYYNSVTNAQDKASAYAIKSAFMTFCFSLSFAFLLAATICIVLKRNNVFVDYKDILAILSTKSAYVCSFGILATILTIVEGGRNEYSNSMFNVGLFLGYMIVFISYINHVKNEIEDKNKTIMIFIVSTLGSFIIMRFLVSIFRTMFVTTSFLW